MADTKKPAAKAEAKAGTKDKSSTDAKTETKDKSSTDAGSDKETESSKSDAPKGYSRGENQKLVTDAYRDNWNSIFSKKQLRKSKK